MTVSSIHPHGPADPRWITEDGRCLLCADSYHKRAIQEQAQTISQLTKERDKWKQVALDYDDEICDWKNASGLSGETVDLTHEMLASKLSQLTKRAEAAEANAAAIHQLAEDMFSDAMKYPQLRLTEMHLERVKWMIRKNHGATLLARLKSLEDRNKELEQMVNAQNALYNEALKVSTEGGGE